MNNRIETAVSLFRESKSWWLRHFRQDSLFSIREVCNLLHTDIPNGMDPDKKFSMICCFEGVFLRDCLYVHYERDKDTVAKAAIHRGAAALLTSHQIEDYPCIIVDDVLGALNTVLCPLAQRVHIPTTVITGSVGKTTTKNFVNSVYSAHERTFCNITNGNTFEYVGFELQRFDKKAKRFVQEVNESDPRNTANCSQVLCPEIAIITNMDKSHIGELGSEENIMRSICEITDGMDENGTVIYNLDDPNSRKVSFRQKTISVAIQDISADCVARRIVSFSDRIEFDVSFNKGTAHLVVPVTGTHNVYDAMMAYVAGIITGIPVNTIQKGLRRYKPLGFRQNIYRNGGCTIYADCYNASAKSIRSALEVLASQPRRSGTRKIAVLGDIGEIDGFEEDIYRDIAVSVSASDVDILITFGKDSLSIQDLLTRKIEAWHEETLDKLCDRINELKRNNDVFLFKASRSMHLEKAIQKTFPYAYLKGMLPVYLAYGRWTMKTL